MKIINTQIKKKTTNTSGQQITKLKVWHGLWLWHKGRRVGGGGKLHFPLNEQCITLWWYTHRLIASMCEQSYVTFTGCVWCYGDKKHECCDLYMVVRLSLYPHLIDSLFLCFAKFVITQGWGVMDIQWTRTASETGTGRQFDTTQRHLITAVADKTHF